jgi:hypothetical protein
LSNAQDVPITGLRMTALTVENLAKILSKSGARTVTADTIRTDITAGAPVNPDGTVNLVAYAAWLVKGSTGGN